MEQKKSSFSIAIPMANMAMTRRTSRAIAPSFKDTTSTLIIEE
jgi:hypothetical protein